MGRIYLMLLSGLLAATVSDPNATAQQSRSDQAPSAISKDVPSSPLAELMDAVNPTPSFRVELAIVGGKTAFPDGDHVAFELSSDSEGYAILLSRDAEGKVWQLWPNPWSKEALIHANQRVSVPGPTTGKFAIEARAPHGIVVTKLIVSKQPIQIDGVRVGDSGKGLTEVPTSKGFVAVGDPDLAKPQPITHLDPKLWATASVVAETYDRSAGRRPDGQPVQPVPPVPALPPTPAPTPSPGVPIVPPNPPENGDPDPNERQWERWMAMVKNHPVDVEQKSVSVSSGKGLNEPTAAVTRIIVIRKGAPAGGKGLDEAGAGGLGGDVTVDVIELPQRNGAKGVNAPDLEGEVKRIRQQDGVITAFPDLELSPCDRGTTYLDPLFYNLHNDMNPGADIGLNEECAKRIATLDAPLIGLVDQSPFFSDPRVSRSIAVHEDAPGSPTDSWPWANDHWGWDFIRHCALGDDPPGDFSHGAFCASLIAGRPIGSWRDVPGIIPDGHIVMASVFWGDAKPGYAQIRNAIIYCARRGARVINLSLGHPCLPSELDETALDPLWGQLRAARILLVCAAGNDNSNNDVLPFWPASMSTKYDNVVSVMATDPAGNAARARLAPHVWKQYSNYGRASVTLAAPGTEILGVPCPNRVMIGDGTSFAAPQVTAAAALIMAEHPDWTPAMVIKRLATTSTPEDVLGGKCQSGGIVNLAKAL